MSEFDTAEAFRLLRLLQRSLREIDRRAPEDIAPVVAKYRQQLVTMSDGLRKAHVAAIISAVEDPELLRSHSAMAAERVSRGNWSDAFDSAALALYSIFEAYNSLSLPGARTTESTRKLDINNLPRPSLDGSLSLEGEPVQRPKKKLVLPKN